MISVCYILRDAEKHIEKSLDSVYEADEIVCVIDSRSKDDTYHICCNYEHKLIRPEIYEWGNFATARNYGIEKANGDWILILDADETVEDFKQIKLLTTGDKDIWSMIQLDKSGQMCRTLRLFKNKIGIKYTENVNNKIHENLNWENYSIGHSEVVINHNKELTKEEHQAKMKWILEDINSIDESIKKDYYQGIYYVHTGDHARGQECLNRVINQLPDSLKAFVMLNVANLYGNIALMYEAESLRLINKSIETVPEQNQGYVLLANHYLKIKEPAEAIKCLDKVRGLSTKLQNDIYYSQEKLKELKNGINSN